MPRPSNVGSGDTVGRKSSRPVQPAGLNSQRSANGKRPGIIAVERQWVAGARRCDCAGSHTKPLHRPKSHRFQRSANRMNFMRNAAWKVCDNLQAARRPTLRDFLYRGSSGEGWTRRCNCRAIRLRRHQTYGNRYQLSGMPRQSETHIKSRAIIFSAEELKEWVGD